MKKILYRISQFFFSIAMNSVKKTPKITLKNDSLSEIPSMLLSDRQSRAFIVTTSGFIKRGTLEPLFSAFQEKNIPYSVFSDVTPDPDFICIENGVKEYSKSGGGAIIAIGGGSVIDCAKVIGARAVKPRQSIKKMHGLLKILKELPILYAVPSTAGTGSEVTCASVITDSETHTKYVIEDFSLIPKRAVLDPCITLGLPSYMTAVTGMDALTHAVEAYTNRFSSHFVKKKASTAVKLIFENLESAHQNGNNIEARKALLYASMLAGQAINRGFIGYVHALAHGIGGMYGVVHGEACSALLPEVLEKYGKSVVKPLSMLAKSIGLNGKTNSELAENFICEIKRLRASLNLPSNFEKLKKEDISELVRRASKEANPLYPVPNIWSEKDFSDFLETKLK